MQAAVVILVEPEGRALFLRRGLTAPTYPGYWNFPGGYLKRSEKGVDGALRELGEETGIQLRRADLVPAFSYRAPEALIHVFSARLAVRPWVSFPDGEHDAYAWLPLYGMPHPVTPGVSFIVSGHSRSAF
jgi:8-oxo-dGTP pyrophosphatase MutT (NUDIX family)